jgi:hypothetical protein
MMIFILIYDDVYIFVLFALQTFYFKSFSVSFHKIIIKIILTSDETITSQAVGIQT